MPTVVKKAERYTAFHYPNGGAGARSRINIYASDNYKLYIIFMPDNSNLPANTFDNQIGIGYEHAHRYPYYLDLLRNEGPAWVTFNSDNKTYVVYCSQEPVGEGEY